MNTWQRSFSFVIFILTASRFFLPFLLNHPIVNQFFTLKYKKGIVYKRTFKRKMPGISSVFFDISSNLLKNNLDQKSSYRKV